MKKLIFLLLILVATPLCGQTRAERREQGIAERKARRSRAIAKRQARRARVSTPRTPSAPNPIGVAHIFGLPGDFVLAEPNVEYQLSFSDERVDGVEVFDPDDTDCLTVQAPGEYSLVADFQWNPDESGGSREAWIVATKPDRRMRLARVLTSGAFPTQPDGIAQTRFTLAVRAELFAGECVSLHAKQRSSEPVWTQIVSVRMVQQ